MILTPVLLIISVQKSIDINDNIPNPEKFRDSYKTI